MPTIFDENGIQLPIAGNNGQINFAHLFIAFEQSLPLLLKISKSFPIKSKESLSYEGECIEKLDQQFLKLDKKIMTLTNHINLLNTNNLRKKSIEDENIGTSALSVLLPRYQLMSTPPIKLHNANKPLFKGLALAGPLSYEQMLLENVGDVVKQAKHNSTLNASSILHTTIKRTTKFDPAEFIKQLHQESVDAMSTNNHQRSAHKTHDRKKNNCSRINLSECIKSPDTRHRRMFVNNESTSLLTSPSGRLTTFLQYDDEFVNKSTPKK